jgi:hypothetical protein
MGFDDSPETTLAILDAALAANRIQARAATNGMSTREYHRLCDEILAQERMIRGLRAAQRNAGYAYLIVDPPALATPLSPAMRASRAPRTASPELV